MSRENVRTGPRARRKGASSPLCWPTCFCITPLINGLRDITAISLSSDTQMMRSCTVAPESKPWMREVIIQRLAECGLELNLQKTKIVYCKDANRRGTHEHEKFNFLGHEFRPRRARNRRGEDFVSFLPAISEKAAKGIRQEMRRWKLQCRSDKSIEDLARMFNPKIRGWMQYYGRYYRSRLYHVFR